MKSSFWMKKIRQLKFESNETGIERNSFLFYLWHLINLKIEKKIELDFSSFLHNKNRLKLKLCFKFIWDWYEASENLNTIWIHIKKILSQVGFESCIFWSNHKFQKVMYSKFERIFSSKSDQIAVLYVSKSEWNLNFVYARRLRTSTFQLNHETSRFRQQYYDIKCHESNARRLFK